MKNLLLALSILLAAHAAFAQAENASAYFEFGAWANLEDQKTAIIFADICNVRTAPDAKSTLVGKLTIDMQVNLLEVTKVQTKMSGITAPWVKISTNLITGYVWGGVLTLDRLKLDDGSHVLWGITEVKKKNGEENAYASVRVVDQGTLKTKSDFMLTMADRPNVGWLEIGERPLIDGMENLVVYNTPSESCGVYSSQHYMLYGQGNLHFVGSGYSMGDGGLLHESLSFEFPYPPKDGEMRDFHYVPEAGHILRIHNEGGYDDDCIWVETTKTANFTWTESGLVKSCENE